MTEFLLGFFIFFAGVFIGAIAAAIYFATLRDEEEFDGGFAHHHRIDQVRPSIKIYSNTMQDQ